jgi:hypothetical protein
MKAQVQQCNLVNYAQTGQKAYMRYASSNHLAKKWQDKFFEQQKR